MTRVPDWKLERYALGELPPEEQEAVRASLEAEEGGMERLARLESSDREILLTHPPRDVVGAIERKAGVRSHRRARNLTLLALPLALAVGGGLLLALPEEVAEVAHTLSDDDYQGIKGPAIQVHRKVEGGDEALLSEDPAAAGDVLQLSYQADGWAHGVILSLDGAGAVTLHHPLDGDTRLDLQGRIHLPDAYRLDDAPTYERFVMVRSHEPLSVQQIVSAAHELAQDPQRAATDDLPLSNALNQDSLILWKSP